MFSILFSSPRSVMSKLDLKDNYRLQKKVLRIQYMYVFKSER